MNQIKVTRHDGTITAATSDSADQDGAYHAGSITAATYTIVCDERLAAYIRWRMYKAQQEDGSRKRAAAIHAALKAAGVPA